jgi:ubiquinone/menaquinone biosynthesis C-methylase UbiE
MLALARSRLAHPGLGHCAVRLADMYRLPLADASFDTAVLQMVLHYAEDPPSAVAEAARVLRPGGRLVVIDLAHHAREDLTARRAHRWPGFSDAAIHQLLTDAALDPVHAVTIPGPLDVRIWCATRMQDATADASLEQVN